MPSKHGRIALTLIRDTYSRDMGTFGILTLWAPKDGDAPEEGRRAKLAEFHTVERPWANNAPNVSCIPVGKYVCGWRTYYRGGYDTLEIEDVPGRDHILFHRGNTMLDVEGCVAIGTARTSLNGRWSVADSRVAFSKFISVLEDVDHGVFPLQIANIAAGRVAK